MRALRSPDFRRLWLAGLISDTGDWLLLASLPILAYLYTGSTLGTAVAFLIELAPPVLLAPVTGFIADRFDRRKTMMAVNLAQAFALLPLMFVHGKNELPIVYAVIAVQAGLASLFDPTKNALLPTLIPPDELVSANSMVGLNQNIGRLIGAPIGGLLLATAGGLAMIVTVDAVSFLAAVILIARLNVRPAASVPTQRSATATASEGDWRAALRPTTIRGGLALTFVASIAQGLFVVLYVVFVERALHGGSGEIGLLRGVQAIGAIGGGLLLAIVARLRPGKLTAVAAVGFGLIVLVIWNAPHVTTAIWLYVVLFIAVGLPGVAMTTGLISSMQQATPEGMRGKVFASFGVAAATGQALGIVAGGVLGDPLGVVTVLNAQGILYLIAGAMAAVWLRTPLRLGGVDAAREPAPDQESEVGLVGS